jgi:hypothetical protein
MGALRWRGWLVVAVGLAVCWLTQGSRIAPTLSWAQAPASKQPTLIASSPVVGTYGCSARACHGGLEPLRGPGVLQNEHTTWILHDPHADAYRVLFDDRSKSIAKNLGGQAPAHEDVRCLACHTNPWTATAEKTPAILEERLFGVGCEACHGAARDWFKDHTRPDWEKLEPKQKKARGMIPVSDLASRVEACAGCHVGAAPDAMGAPLRDVNHDLIAAGHPRLDFEFGAFQANMPRHWKDTEKKPGSAAQAWTIGQLGAAQAALKLLEYRTHDEKRWPEFAEYDCYACHHSLHEPSARQQHGYEGRRPGSFPWGTWYFAMPRALATPAAGGEARKLLDELAQVMQGPYPDRKQVEKQAGQTGTQFEQWLQKVNESGDSSAKLLKALTMDPKLAEASWDSATQLYLALFSLDEVRGNAGLATALRALSQKQAFPAEHDSPGDKGSHDFRSALSTELKRFRQ